ncbi:MAG: hypothetical protein WBB19_14180 [Desulforhopalus sp.]
MARKEKNVDISQEQIIEVLESPEIQALIKELNSMAPPFEELAQEEIEDIQKTGKLLATKAEAYYFGYLKAAGRGIGPQADGSIVGAVVGSTVGTVVGQIVGKKLDSSINVRDLVINPALRSKK